jgi:hypothetical protein
MTTPKALFIKTFLISFFFIFFISTVLLFGDESGRTGRTLKTSTAGCGGCHGSSATVDVSVIISGPDTVNVGQQVQYTLTVSKQTKTGAGLDIATRLGTLSPISTNIHLASGELTHNSNIPMTNGSVTVTFRYTAPGTAVTDTLWATGNATNSNGSTSGDEWNWAASKRIIVRNPTGIEHNNSLKEFELSQNYPNPFNPNTKFTIVIPKQENVKVLVYDIAGEEVTTLVNSVLKPGEYNLDWNSTNSFGNPVSSGVYFYRIVAGDFTDVKKMILIK